jgi:hypothetical protein
MAARVPAQFGLFGGIERPRVEPHGPPRRKPTPANGYAAMPGTGPVGETCGTCAHCVTRDRTKKTYWKCLLRVATWTCGRATDIVRRSPACHRWQRGEPRVTGIVRVRAAR